MASADGIHFGGIRRSRGHFRHTAVVILLDVQIPKVNTGQHRLRRGRIYRNSMLRTSCSPSTFIRCALSPLRLGFKITRQVADASREVEADRAVLRHRHLHRRAAAARGVHHRLRLDLGRCHELRQLRGARHRGLALRRTATASLRTDLSG